MAAFANQRLHLLGFVRTHIVVGKNLLHHLHTLLYLLLIVRGTVHPKQIFQHIAWNICPFLYIFCQVFTDNFAAVALV